MDRLNQLRGEAGPSRDSTLDTSSPPSEAFMSANESSSKYFSLSEVDSTFDISPIKDVSLASSAIEAERTESEPDRLISNLSPIGKKNDFLDSYKIGKQIEAANILSGGIDIFDDNDNSYDGDELVIDDNAVTDDRGNTELKITEAELKDDITEATLVEEPVPSKDTEVILQIDGKNVDAIDIGNGLYLYRREGEDELAAVQIDEDQQLPTFKFLKVRENAEGNLEVYEEIQIEVPKESPAKEGKSSEKHEKSCVPVKDSNKIVIDAGHKIESDINIENENPTELESQLDKESSKEQTNTKTDINGKLMKFSESRKSPVVGSFTPMTFHSTPNKEGIPLTKTMVDLQLHPNRHSDNVKKTIEVHTDNSKQKIEPQRNLIKDFIDDKNKQPITQNKIDAEEKKLIIEESNKEDSVKDISINTETVAEEENTMKKPEAEEIKHNIVKSNECSENLINKPVTEIQLPTENTEDTNVTNLLHIDEGAIENVDTNKEIKIDGEKKGEAKPQNSTADTVDKSPSDEINDLGTEDIAEEKKNNRDEQNNDFNVEVDSKVCVSVSNTDNKLIPTSSDITNNRIDKEESKDVHVKYESQTAKINEDNETKSNENKSDSDVRKKELSPLPQNVSTTENVIPEIDRKSNEDQFSSKKVLDKCTEVIEEDKSENMDISIDETIETSKEIITEVLDTITKVVNNIVEPTDSEGKKILTNKIADNITEEKSKCLNNPKKESLEEIQTSNMKVCETLKDNENKSVVKKDVAEKIEVNKKEIVDKIDTDDRKSVVAAVDIANKETNKMDTIKIQTTEKNQPTKNEISTHELSNNVNKQTVGVTGTVREETSNRLAAKIEAPSMTIRDNSETKVESLVNVENKNTKNKEPKPVLEKIVQNKDDLTDKRNTKVSSIVDVKSTSNSHAPVPFGKWTEANRQAFLNKIKESKVPSNSSNSKQIKNSNDLNRRDFLKKIDTQRPIQSNTNITKVQDFGSGNRLVVKKEASVFSANKPVAQETKLPVKTETVLPKLNATSMKRLPKSEIIPQPLANTNTPIVASEALSKKEPAQRKEINNQDLIDKTIEGIINRVAPSKSHEDVKDTIQASPNVESENAKLGQPAGLDEIEMKMNELHGIPFIERPAHELPRVSNPGIKTYSKSESQKVSSSNTRQSKLPNLIPFGTKNQQKGVKENIIDIDSEEDVIEHEPITGDMDVVNKNITKPTIEKSETVAQIIGDIAKKESIITEKDFDKFARRNSISYENRLTVNFEVAKSPNVINTVVEKDNALKSYPMHEKSESKTKSHANELRNQNPVTKPMQNINKPSKPHSELNSNKNYQSKVKMAYQTAMTAKRQLERPITIIEDKPVKVVYMDSNAEYIPRQLNAQGKDLSPAKKQTVNVDLITASDSLDSDILEIEDGKIIEDTKSKTKHQRKQVLTPVETPDLELISPDDLGIEVSPKKKRKTEEKIEKNAKPVVPKKSYLLGRESIKEDTNLKTFEVAQVFNKDSQSADKSSHKNTASAIDSLVKAAELLETQSENIINKTSPEIQNSDSQQNTPVKRGRGRPRKYPLPEGTPIVKAKVPSPQKKPRLADTKPVKNKETDDEDSSDGEMIKENWTMGKINENIVCPICNKLFRSENVVFKHVKHCTGPSPNRSESGNKSPRRLRGSQDFENKSDYMDFEDDEPLVKEVLKKRKSRDTNPKSTNDKSEVIIIEDTPIKVNPEKRDESKPMDSRKSTINKSKANNLICEFCGKTFRQLSYLVNHKLQHEKEDTKKIKTDVKSLKSVFSCEVCKKEFRKLHHLVQHRIIHNLNNPTSAKRKNSSEQNENKILKETVTKQSDDASAGFRCEPCDKSFRKLHHLVEHRETHDGINRQKSTATLPAPVEKPPPPPQCDICKKTFRKLHHLIEHKEQHLETSSEKSDDKSIKSTLSTKDIIHECSLCYMVFPNEHSLTKHTIICQRKKRQSASKQANQTEQNDSTEEDNPSIKTDDDMEKDEVIIITTEIKETVTEVVQITEIEKSDKGESDNIIRVNENTIDLSTESPKICNIDNAKEVDSEQKEIITDTKTHKDVSVASQILHKIKDVDATKIKDTPKENIRKSKKTPSKDKVASTVTKRQKLNPPLPVVDEVKIAESDDDEIRYMLNPDFKSDSTIEGKTFMKVRANKRNSLQIERPNSKDLVKRRISLQHPPKIPRLKPKSIPKQAVPINTSTVIKNVKPLKFEPVPSTDSDDSDVKYSFPKTADKINKTVTEEPLKEPEKKKPRKSLAEKNKLLTGIAKRKSLGKTMSPKNKVKPIPVKLISKKRIAEIEHRCDCGQLFSSAALLSRHTTLAHTPPRIRRRRSPLPETKPVKPISRQISTTSKSKQTETKSPNVKSESLSNSKIQSPGSRKSKVQKLDVKHTDVRKSLKPNDKVDAAKHNLKIRRTAAHKGVPVPEKMRKYMEKFKK